MCFSLFIGQEKGSKGEHGQDFTGETGVDVLLASSSCLFGLLGLSQAIFCPKGSPALKD